MNKGTETTTSSTESRAARRPGSGRGETREQGRFKSMVFEALNALASATAVVIAGTDIEITMPFFMQALTQNINEISARARERVKWQ